MNAGRPRLVAGIDEAGLDPLLGPLTLGFSLFELPHGAFSIWEKLEQAVSRDPKHDAERLIVADSKRVFTRNPRGRRRLESTALAFLDQRAGREKVRTGRDLLHSAPPALRPGEECLRHHPWYAELPHELPLAVDAGRLELRAARLERELLIHDMRLLDAGAIVLPAGELNRSWRRTGNKSRTVWEKLAGLLQFLFEEHGSGAPEVFIDRQGGRSHYAGPLLHSFPDAELEVVSEGASHSEYVLRDGPRRMRLLFAERAEDRAFSVALASCLAKYARETCMGAFNRFFGRLQPDLAPTAGYTTDGRRWIEAAEEALRQVRLADGVLVRER